MVSQQFTGKGPRQSTDFIKGNTSHIDSVLGDETTWMHICTHSGKTEVELLWAAITLTRWLPANLWPKVICSYWEYHSTEHYVSPTQFSKNSTAFPLSAIYSSLSSLGELPELLVLGMEICRQILKPANTSHRTLALRWVGNIIGQGILSCVASSVPTWRGDGDLLRSLDQVCDPRTWEGHHHHSNETGRRMRQMKARFGESFLQERSSIKMAEMSPEMWCRQGCIACVI